jgi:hypothetical protein
VKGIYYLLQAYANYGSPELVLAEWFSGTCPLNTVHHNLTIQSGSPELVLAEWFSRTCPFSMVNQNLTMHYGLTELVLAE